MRHYEIVFLVHPDQSIQVPEMIKRYKSIIESRNGKVHRLENWGLRKLAYPINKSNEAHYVLMNIECSQEARKEIIDSFHFSDAVLRNLILSREGRIIEHSPILKVIEKAKEDEKARKSRHKHGKDIADKAKTSSSESNKEDTKQLSKKAPGSEKEAVKTTKKTKESEKANNQESNDATTLTEDNTQDAPTEDEHADSTKK